MEDTTRFSVATVVPTTELKYVTPSFVTTWVPRFWHPKIICGDSEFAFSNYDGHI